MYVFLSAIGSARRRERSQDSNTEFYSYSACSENTLILNIEDSNTDFYSYSACFANTFILNMYAFERSGVQIQTRNSIHILPALRIIQVGRAPKRGAERSED